MSQRFYGLPSQGETEMAKSEDQWKTVKVEIEVKALLG